MCDQGCKQKNLVGGKKFAKGRGNFAQEEKIPKCLLSVVCV